MKPALARAVAAFRLLTLLYAIILVAADHHYYLRPGLGWVLLGGMSAWTVATVIVYERLAVWPVWFIAADVAVAVGLVLATIAVVPSARIDAGAPTFPAAWAASPVLIAAIAYGPWLGGVAGGVVSAADVVERRDFTQHTFNGIVLLLMAGVVGGYVVRLAQRAEDVIEAAARREAATAERDRLAREIHDSTLQVLALVAKRGTALGGEPAELAALAAEQEAVLRQLVATPPAAAGRGDELDLRLLVAAMATARVTVSSPAEPVLLGHDAALAVVGALAEALANVSRHAGPDARAWILVEDEAAAVTVSIRDDGPGFDSGRLEAAAAGGRLGVTQSILGRIEAAGGSATVTSPPRGGTEVEIRVPR